MSKVIRSTQAVFRQTWNTRSATRSLPRWFHHLRNMNAARNPIRVFEHLQNGHIGRRYFHGADWRQQGSEFPRVYRTSEPLRDVIGFYNATFSQAVKGTFDYAKANKLEDSNNKRYILGDEKLKRLFKEDRIPKGDIPEKLKRHLY